jgi:hypothetical protein
MAPRFTLTNLAAAAMLMLPAAGARAQSPINSPGAMQPSRQTLLVHEMFQYRSLGDDPSTGEQGADEFIGLTQLAWGVSRNFSLQFDLPVVHREFSPAVGDDASETSIADMTLWAKWRLWQHDTGPIDTMRFSLIGGLQIPGDSDYRMDASHDSLNPLAGFVFSLVRGRHGVNASALLEYHTGGVDGSAGVEDHTLRYDGSYLFRFEPAQYTTETEGAWYVVAELNGVHDFNGDDELFLSPGLMYEARKFTLDATVMIPVWQDLDHRAETDFIIGAGVRIPF